MRAVHVRLPNWLSEIERFDPEAYLRHVFARTADHPITPITELLPWEYRSVGA